MAIERLTDLSEDVLTCIVDAVQASRYITPEKEAEDCRRCLTKLSMTCQTLRRLYVRRLFHRTSLELNAHPDLRRLLSTLNSSSTLQENVQ